MALTYNLEHNEVGPTKNATVDVAGAITMTLSIASSPAYLNADAGKYAVAWSAPEGSGSLTFAESDDDVLAVINGGRLSTSGTAGTLINRYEQPGTATNPQFLISGFARNMSPTTRTAFPAFRITVPAASASPATMSMGQETWGEWTANLGFVADGNNTLIIYEHMASVPVLTAGVMGATINLTPPV